VSQGKEKEKEKREGGGAGLMIIDHANIIFLITNITMYPTLPGFILEVSPSSFCVASSIVSNGHRCQEFWRRLFTYLLRALLERPMIVERSHSNARGQKVHACNNACYHIKLHRSHDRWKKRTRDRTQKRRNRRDESGNTVNIGGSLGMSVISIFSTTCFEDTKPSQRAALKYDTDQ
jgi:hypothetical protein